MRDFPVFTTENGVGSLVLKEIPYKGTAYVTIRDSSFPTEFLRECIEFCRTVGADRIYASGHEILERFPLYTSVVAMSAAFDTIPDTDACLFPVTEQSLSKWRDIYNDRMRSVDNAAYMSDRSAREMLQHGDGYFIHRDGKLLGIGRASDDRIDCVASVVPGSGKDIVSALTHALICDRVQLNVATTNLRALRLYQELGFIKTAEVSRWFKIY